MHRSSHPDYLCKFLRIDTGWKHSRLDLTKRSTLLYKILFSGSLSKVHILIKIIHYEVLHPTEMPRSGLKKTGAFKILGRHQYVFFCFVLFCLSALAFVGLTPEISTDKVMYVLWFSGILLTNGTVPSVKADYAGASVVVYLVFTCCAIATRIWNTVINV